MLKVLLKIGIEVCMVVGKGKWMVFFTVGIEMVSTMGVRLNKCVREDGCHKTY